MPEVAQRIYPLNGGLNNALPAWGIAQQELAEAKNMRVWQGELRTCKGYVSSTSSVIRTGVTSIKGLGYAIRADGTEDLIAAADAGLWKLVGDTKTLISTSRARGLISSVSGTAVSGDADVKFTADFRDGDTFWMDADGVSKEVQVASIETVSTMVLSAAYGGATTAGSYSGWWKQNDSRTRMAFWNDRWHFVNSSGVLMRWDGSIFREAGLVQPNATWAVSATPDLTAGSLETGKWYGYRIAYRDALSAFGLPATEGSNVHFQVSAATSSIKMICYDGSAQGRSWDSVLLGPSGRGAPAEVQDIMFFRNGPFDTAAEVSAAFSAGHSYIGQLVDAGTSAFEDDGVLAVAISGAIEYNFPPDAGYQDLTVIDGRLAALCGRKLVISGLPPTDEHTISHGLDEPGYWPTELRIGDGEEADSYGFLTLRGRTYIIGSRNVFLVNVRGDDPATWLVRVHLPNIGTVSRWSIATAGDVAYWLGRARGRLTVLAFDGYRITDIGSPVQGILGDVDTSKFSEVAAGVGKGFYWLCVPITGGTYKTLEFNSNAGVSPDGRVMQRWCWRDWQVQDFAQAEGDIYAAFQDGMVNKLESGYAKVTAAQDYEWETHAGDLEAPEWKKHYRSMQAEFDVYAGSPSVSAKYVLDEAAAVAVPNSPVALSSTPLFRVGLSDVVYGQRVGINFTASGNDLDFSHRGIVLKGEPDKQDKD